MLGTFERQKTSSNAASSPHSTILNSKPIVPRRLLRPPRPILAVFTIAGSHPSRRTSRSPDSDPSSMALALPSSNFATASNIISTTRALRRSGFVSIAILLRLFPDRLLPAPAATVFAIPDAALEDFFSLPPWLLLVLLRYHAAQSKLSFTTSPPQDKGMPVPQHSAGQGIWMAER